MSSTIFFFLFIPLLAFILLAINLIFAPHNAYVEKNSAFECGFSSFLGQNRTQFSVSFFIFALLFLLFDLEILLVYPYLVSAYVNGIYGLTILLLFLLALTLGFAFELGKKALSIDSRQVSNESTNASTKVSKAWLWSLSSPAKPNAFVSLPLQSSINLSKTKILFFVFILTTTVAIGFKVPAKILLDQLNMSALYILFNLVFALCSFLAITCLKGNKVTIINLFFTGVTALLFSYLVYKGYIHEIVSLFAISFMPALFLMPELSHYDVYKGGKEYILFSDSHTNDPTGTAPAAPAGGSGGGGHDGGNGNSSPSVSSHGPPTIEQTGWNLNDETREFWAKNKDIKFIDAGANSPSWTRRTIDGREYIGTKIKNAYWCLPVNVENGKSEVYVPCPYTNTGRHSNPFTTLGKRRLNNIEFTDRIQEVVVGRDDPIRESPEKLAEHLGKWEQMLADKRARGIKSSVVYLGEMNLTNQQLMALYKFFYENAAYNKYHNSLIGRIAITHHMVIDIKNSRK